MNANVIRHKKHTFQLNCLTHPAQETWSLKCVDLADGEDASLLDWPSDQTVSRTIGVRVKFFDGGDDLTEAIYHRVEP